MRLNAPIPGANYMADTRNYAWHRPPDMVDYDEAVSYLIDKIDEPEEKELIFAMLGIDAHITTVDGKFKQRCCCKLGRGY